MKLQTRARSREISLGKIKIGGRNKISVQTMLQEELSTPLACIKKIKELECVHCDIVRVAVRNDSEIKYVKDILKETDLPIVADIQFKGEHAIEAIQAGFNGVRINPGYLSEEKLIKEIIEKAKEYNTCVRVGFNSGSFPKNILKGKEREGSLLHSVKKWDEFFLENEFLNYKYSIKSSNTLETISLNREVAKITEAPLHLGVTEASDLMRSTIRSSIAFYDLLKDSIGDTIRVSITGDPCGEVLAGREILRVMGLNNESINLISCPTCSRCACDIEKIIYDLNPLLSCINLPYTVAVMGCAVNGPGEAKEADLGIAAISVDRFALFRKGKRIKNIDAKDAVKILVSEIKNL